VPLSRREIVGIVGGCASSVLGGTAVVATRSVIAATDPATLGALRYSIGAACLLPLVLCLGATRPQKRDLVPIALLGVLFFAIFPWLFNDALSYTTAAHGALALSTLPFLTLLLASLLRAEPLTGFKLAGVGCATLGVTIALSSRLAGLPPGAWYGDLVMVGTALCGALYNVLARPYLARYPALSFTAFAMTAGAVAMLILASATGAPGKIVTFGAKEWGEVAFLGVAGAALTFFLWSFALERTTPTRVATTVALNPIVSLGLGAALLGEPWSLQLIVGLVAVGLGILLASASPRVVTRRRACASR
jgi:drug/metabolite transporter (DMT)-like permease